MVKSVNSMSMGTLYYFCCEVLASSRALEPYKLYCGGSLLNLCSFLSVSAVQGLTGVSTAVEYFPSPAHI